jgi:hypothetical protein
MSKHPSPRMDQLRALREAKYARRNEEAQPQAGVAEEAVEGAPKKAKQKAKKKTKR